MSTYPGRATGATLTTCILKPSSRVHMATFIFMVMKITMGKGYQTVNFTNYIFIFFFYNCTPYGNFLHNCNYRKLYTSIYSPDETLIRRNSMCLSLLCYVAKFYENLSHPDINCYK
jgi:hypothetical protein